MDTAGPFAQDIVDRGEAGVHGALLIDSDGLCVSAKGEVQASSAAHLHSMLQRAQGLAPEGERATVVVETASRRIVVQGKGERTVALVQSVGAAAASSPGAAGRA